MNKLENISQYLLSAAKHIIPSSERIAQEKGLGLN